ncbi:MAG TPA: hypothetical protein VKX49_09040 [Bryobacteraceae bacterium]|nr:hypothetical protein [Bryobacteraceae bacterium]
MAGHGGRAQMGLREVIMLLQRFKETHPSARKADVQHEFVAKCAPIRERSVFVREGFALRFCEANTPSFSNVVLSLSALRKHDLRPMVICIVRPNRLDFRLANTTFLKRISHSSHQFRTDNIRGSFLGHDILDTYEGVPNEPEHFDKLFALHSAFTWEENVARLVEATNAIVARSTRFQVDRVAMNQLMQAPDRAMTALRTPQYREAEHHLSGIIKRHLSNILAAAELENVNIRGNTIEQIVTAGVNAHRLDDLNFELGRDLRLVVDIKTKLLDRASAPKAYNIDKMLKLLAEGGTVFGFFFIGIDVSRRSVVTRLVPVLDSTILAATRIQTHWAGRASRGVTQLTGDVTRVFERDYRPSINVAEAQTFLRQLVER